MLKVLTQNDVELLINFNAQIKKLTDFELRKLYDEIGSQKILFASIMEDKIDELIIVGLIKNNYYIERVYLLNENNINSLISFALNHLRLDNRGLNVIYDNFPYDANMHDIMLTNGFKCSLLNMVCPHDASYIKLIKPTILLNDKSPDVVAYIHNKLIEETKSNNLLFGTQSDIPGIEAIRLENTNVAVVRDEKGEVRGTLRFGIVSNNLLLDNLYADTPSIIADMLNLVKNLTDKDLEININPNRRNILEMLEAFGFKKKQTDYILKLN